MPTRQEEQIPVTKHASRVLDVALGLKPKKNSTVVSVTVMEVSSR